MSALGQKQTYALQQAMSALPPKADMRGATTDVRFGPIADIRLFDQLVSRQKNAIRYSHAKRFGGFEIDYKLKFCCLLDRQVGCLCAFENFGHVVRTLAIDRRQIGTEADKPAGFDVVFGDEHGGQTVLYCKLGNQRPMLRPARTGSISSICAPPAAAPRIAASKLYDGPSSFCDCTSNFRDFAARSAALN